ncbi:MAG TPA: hydrogenase subunit MbhD domain-containing protein [Gammaproteobacteria bacterium]
MNDIGLLVLDVLLLSSLLSLAWAALASRDERRSVILFMAFGLILALVWGRLLAPDVALAEAAIGAGLSGALLLAAVPRQSRQALQQDEPATPEPNNAGPGKFINRAFTLLCIALAGLLAWALAHAFSQAPADTLPKAVFDHLDASGVSNPVTAVLLNFRAYDTLLELAVLLTALLGIFAVGKAAPGYHYAGQVFDSLGRWLVPLLIILAGYLLWVGAHAPGGAFQAGATLAAAGVVLRLAGNNQAGFIESKAQRWLISAGIAVFLLVGLSMLALGRPFLGYPSAWAGSLILLIETAAMLAIAATLLLAFIGGQSATPHTPGSEETRQ